MLPFQAEWPAGIQQRWLALAKQILDAIDDALVLLPDTPAAAALAHLESLCRKAGTRRPASLPLPLTTRLLPAPTSVPVSREIPAMADPALATVSANSHETLLAPVAEPAPAKEPFADDDTFDSSGEAWLRLTEETIQHARRRQEHLSAEQVTMERLIVRLTRAIDAFHVAPESAVPPAATRTPPPAHPSKSGRRIIDTTGRSAALLRAIYEWTVQHEGQICFSDFSPAWGRRVPLSSVERWQRQGLLSWKVADVYRWTGQIMTVAQSPPVELRGHKDDDAAATA